MNPILVDSSVLKAHLDGCEAAAEFLQTLAQSDAPLPVISVITELEMHRLSWGRADSEIITKLLATVKILPLSSVIAQRAGGLKERYPEIGIEHAIVAATALEYQFTLVAFNVKVYKMIPGLIVFNVPE